MIVRELTALQHRLGYLPDDALRELAARLAVPLYRLQEVASFFPHFRRSQPAKVELQICRDMSCQLRGAGMLLSQCHRAFGEQGNDVQVGGVSCLGRCDRAPAVLVNDRLYVRRAAEELIAIARQVAAGQSPPHDRDLEIPRHAARPWQIDIYNDEAIYMAAREYAAHPDPTRVIRELETANLLGMGGAGGRAFRKWNDVWQAPGDEKYVVCNADESEPGTFKDRELLLRAPHLVIEGMVLAGLLLGARRGYIYIRHEYHEAISAVHAALDRAAQLAICGTGPGQFPIEVFISPGGYICGEQTALIEAMEDHRAEPRNRPPQLETNGLWDKPTLLSNVETFAWVPAILTKGGAWYRDQGLRGCKGRRFFSISGDIHRPGVYEVPNGLTLGELIHEHAGGMLHGKPLLAAALSGPSGGFLPAALPVAANARETLAARMPHLPEDYLTQLLPADGRHLQLLELALDIQHFRELGKALIGKELMLGGGIVVYAEGTDLVDQAVRCLEFFRNESCGKCVPCRLGSQKLVELGARLQNRAFTPREWESQAALVTELGRTMEITSICGLGMVAANPLSSLIKHFPQQISRYQ